MPFLTLENIVAEKKNLKAMFASFEWNRTKWASRTEGKRIVNLVEDRSFWSTARMVLKATIPLVRVLCLINGAYKPQVGYIDKTMDQAKETIKEEFKNKKTQYWPIWEIIDDKTLFPHIIIIRLCLMSDIADHLQCHTENRYKFL